MSRWRETTAVAGLLVAATVVLTWPLAARPSTAIPDFGDSLLHSWILAWDLHALTTAPLRLFDANIFYPRRWTLAFSDHLLGLVPLIAPIGLVGGGPILMHNAVLFVSFPLAGLTMLWLVRHLTGHPGAAIVAALLYAFSHYRFGYLGQVQLLSHQWLPLLLLGLHRTVAHGGRWRDVALAAFAFVMQALSSGYYAYFSAVAIGLFVIWATGPASRPPLVRAARRGLVAGLVAGLLLAPAFYPYYVVQREFGLVRAGSEVELYAARLTSYLAAPVENRWLGAATAPFRRAEGVLFPGIVMLVLATAGCVTVCRRHAGGEPPAAPTAALPPARWPRAVDLVLAAALILTLARVLIPGGLSLGPLRISHRHVEIWVVGVAVALLLRRLLRRRAVPLPGLAWLRRLGWPNARGYYAGLTLLAILCSFGPTLLVSESRVIGTLYLHLYRWMPGFDGLRVPSRFAMLASTGLAVLAGYGVAALARRLEARAVRATVVAALGGLAVVEAWTIPFPYRDWPRDVRPVEGWLAGAESSGAVAILPMYGDVHGEARRLIESTAHWRPLVNGYSGFFPPGYQETERTLNAFPAPAALAHLRELGVRYVVLELDGYPRDARARLEAGLRALPPGLARVAAFEETVILEVARGP